MKSRLCAVALITVWPISSAYAAEGKSLSVYEVKPLVDGAIIGVTGLGNLLPEVFASHLITPRCPCDVNEVNSFDRGVIGNANVFLDGLSDASVGVAALGPIALDLIDVGWSREFAEDLTVYAETLSVSGALVTLAKYTVQRPLPRVYAGQDPKLASEPGGYRSFYSGHTSLTFAALSVASVTLNLRHHAGVWPWIATAAIGTSVAAERIAAGRHFYTDVMVGAVAGTAVGVLVPWLHRRELEGAPHVGLMSIGDGLALTWERRI